MNRNQPGGRESQKKTNDDKSMKGKGHSEEHDSKDGAVLGKINDNTRKKGK